MLVDCFLNQGNWFLAVEAAVHEVKLVKSKHFHQALHRHDVEDLVIYEHEPFFRSSCSLVNLNNGLFYISGLVKVYFMVRSHLIPIGPWLNVVNRLFTRLSVTIVQQKVERKPWACPNFRLYRDFTIKLLSNLFTDEQAQTNSLGVHLLSIFYSAEHFKQVLLIFGWDADARIFHRDHKLWFYARHEQIVHVF